MFIVDAFQQIFQTLSGFIINIPTTNPLSVLYLVANFVAQIVVLLFGGTTDVNLFGGSGL